MKDSYLYLKTDFNRVLMSEDFLKNGGFERLDKELASKAAGTKA